MINASSHHRHPRYRLATRISLLTLPPAKKKEIGNRHTSAIEFSRAEHDNPIVMPRGSRFTIWYTKHDEGPGVNNPSETTVGLRSGGVFAPCASYLATRHNGYRKQGLLCHWSGGMFLIMHDLALEGHCVIWPEQVTRLTLTTIRPMSGACRASRKRTDVDDLPLGTSIRRGLSLNSLIGDITDRA